MTTLKEGFITLPSADFNGESTLPSIAGVSNVQQMAKSALDEDDELFVGYGFLPSIFPYRMQDLYNRAQNPRRFQCITLENDYLIARFLPELGGRLYSLFDKKAGRELLYCNPIIRPCNLAVRNAWLAGGVEFNMGMVGHHPYTCSPIFAAKTSLSDGTPVLRMYEFERIRACVYQMDFFLPEGSPLLYVRVRIVNPNRATVPMYWWSNIAVPEGKDCRNVIDATKSYNNSGGCVGKNEVPIRDGIDITYPTNNPIAVDYFWNIPPEKRKFTAHLDGNGYGLVQTSTARQQGRKLFVWGQGAGGDRWQQFLTADGLDGRYVEIQAGIAHTQYECLPMPPLTAWEWLEGYGAMNADPTRVHGDWAEARAEVAERLNEIASAESLETLLRATHSDATSKAGELICRGGGWGALENLRREADGESIMCPHLDFGDIEAPQKPWADLLKNGSFGDYNDQVAPISWMLQNEWTKKIEASDKNDYAYIQLAAIYFARQEFEKSRVACEKALAIRDSAAVRYILSQILRVEEKIFDAANEAYAACRLSGYDLSFARQSAKMLYSADNYTSIIELYNDCSPAVKEDGRMRMFYSLAMLKLGDLEAAEAEFWRNGGISVTDIREGEVSITDLYLDLAESKANKDGIPFDREDCDVPVRFDFRMKKKRKTN